MTDAFNIAWPERLLALGREGLSAAEMAADLGLPLADLERLAEGYADLGNALTLAETLALAWWDAQPRLALVNNQPFRATAWAKAMVQRYGGAYRPSETADPAGAEPVPLARYEIPPNGREARRRVRGAG